MRNNKNIILKLSKSIQKQENERIRIFETARKAILSWMNGQERMEIHDKVTIQAHGHDYYQLKAIEAKNKLISSEKILFIVAKPITKKGNAQNVAYDTEAYIPFSELSLSNSDMLIVMKAAYAAFLIKLRDNS